MMPRAVVGAVPEGISPPNHHLGNPVRRRRLAPAWVVKRDATPPPPPPTTSGGSGHQPLHLAEQSRHPTRTSYSSFMACQKTSSILPLVHAAGGLRRVSGGFLRTLPSHDRGSSRKQSFWIPALAHCVLSVFDSTISVGTYFRGIKSGKGRTKFISCEGDRAISALSKRLGSPRKVDDIRLLSSFSSSLIKLSSSPSNPIGTCGTSDTRERVGVLRAPPDCDFRSTPATPDGVCACLSRSFLVGV
jgi:hypothetical protein